MLDYQKIERYRENNRIEAKKALGGLPKSMWETYSAFANTIGGVILLGVEELPDHSLRPVRLPDPEGMIREMREILQDRRQVSADILKPGDITVHQEGECVFISVTVPRAGRQQRPVYIHGDPYAGSYRRNGEGDYRCTPEQVSMMLRDRSEESMDGRLLQNFTCDDFFPGTVERYRRLLKQEGDTAGKLERGAMFLSIGATGERNGKVYPTCAGMLMFGTYPKIRKVFPDYELYYREGDNETDKNGYCLLSGKGNWSGNVFDFYYRISERLARMGEDPVTEALREALLNAVVNADYFGTGGLLIEKRKAELRLSNPGGFRIPVEEAARGGRSDPRNRTLIRMFSRVLGEKGKGAGLCGIYDLWKKKGWERPDIREEFSPDRTTLSLPMEPQKRHGPRYRAKMKILLDFITDQITCSRKEAAQVMGLSEKSAGRYLKELLHAQLIEAEGKGASRRYRLAGEQKNHKNQH